MREDTTASGYDQPRTDPIPPLGDEPDGSRAQPGQAQGQTQFAGPVPVQAAPVEQPLGGPAPADPSGPESTEPPGPAGIAPDDPEPAPFDRPEPDLMSSTVDDEPAAGPDHAGEGTGAVLFGGEEAERFRLRWRDLQADFVDDPARAVQGADELVDEVLQALTEVFATHKRELEGQWHRGGSGQTEELRVALRSYRSFFDQLLKT
jgi:hypothetical protein